MKKQKVNLRARDSLVRTSSLDTTYSLRAFVKNNRKPHATSKVQSMLPVTQMEVDALPCSRFRSTVNLKKLKAFMATHVANPYKHTVSELWDNKQQTKTFLTCS